MEAQRITEVVGKIHGRPSSIVTELRRVSEATETVGRLKKRGGVVVKIGGSLNGKTGTLLEDLHDLHEFGIPITVIHGGGKKIDERLSELKIPVEFRGGLRVTTPESIKVVQEVLKQLGEDIVTKLRSNGIVAVHVLGRKAFVAEQKPELGLVGTFSGEDTFRIMEINRKGCGILRCMALSGRVVVVTPSARDMKGKVLNVNADEIAEVIAKVTLTPPPVAVFVTETKGVFVGGKVVDEISRSEALGLVSRGEINGGMAPKIKAAAGLAGIPGVKTGIIGCEDHELLKAVFRPGSSGTWIS